MCHVSRPKLASHLHFLSAELLICDNIFRSLFPIPTQTLRVDLVWSPPGGQLDHLTVTGYKIIWFQPEFRTRVSNVTVGKSFLTIFASFVFVC